MRREKSGVLSAASAASLIRERRRSSSKGNVAVHQSCAVEIAIDETVEEMLDVKSGQPCQRRSRSARC